MAFCKQCGADLNGANFCAGCGTPADGVPMQTYQAAPIGADVRQRSLADFEHMTAYFGAKAPQYKEFDEVSEEVATREAYSCGGWIVGAVVCFLIGIFAKAWFFYLLTVGFITLAVLMSMKNKDKLAAARARQQALYAELEEHYKAYGYCSIGFEYTQPATLAALFDMIRKGRATTPSDAINIYLADLEQQKIRELQERATAAAEETARETKRAAKSARKAAGYASASFWFK